MSKKQAAQLPPVGRRVATRVWQALLQHELRVAGVSDDGVRVLPSRRPTPQRAVRPTCVEDVLLGRPQKVLAIETARSQAAISALLQRQMKTMGLEVAMLRLPLALAMLAHAATSDLIEVDFLHREAKDTELFLFRGTISEAALVGLTASERDVALRYLQGQTCAAIAAARSSRPRTVANQLSGIFHRFGTAGRFDLLRVVLEHAQRAGAPCSLELVGPSLDLPRSSATQPRAESLQRDCSAFPATTFMPLQMAW